MEPDVSKWKSLRQLYEGKHFLVCVLLAQTEDMEKQMEAKDKEIAWLREELNPSTNTKGLTQ